MSQVSLSRLDLRLLSVFVSVVEHEGFSTAAQALDMSLSTVTRDISALEMRLGVKLCQRGRSGFSTTAQGEEIYRAALKLMEDVRGFEASVATTKKTPPGALQIGLIDNMISNPDSRINDALATLHRAVPDLVVRSSVHSVGSIDILVRERRIDVGITASPEFLTPLDYIEAFEEKQSLYVSRTCPDFDAIWSWRPGREEPLLPYVARTYTTQHFRGFEAAYPTRTSAIGNNIDGVLASIAAGYGAGILPDHIARTVPHLTALPYPDRGFRIPFYIVIRKDSLRQPAIHQFLKAYRKHMPLTSQIPQA